MPDMIKAKIGGFYGLCASVCLSGARSWCERHNYGGSIHYVFEAGTPGQGQVNKFLNETYMDELARSEYRLNDFSFADKSMKPLQAADIIAYEMGKHALDKKLQRSRPDVVKYMRDLLGFKSEMDMELKYWDRETLNELLSNYKAGILAQR